MRPKSISTTENPDDQDLPDRPSKSQRKRDAHVLQDIGTQLVALSAEQIKRIDMPENLRTAITEAQRTRSHEGLRRQMQYVGKVMRGIDTAPLTEALDAIHGRSARAVAREQMLERMRERLIADELVLGDIAAQWPGADLTHLRTLRRNVLRERELNKPPRAFREIFRVLRQLDNAQSGEDDIEPEQDENDDE
ncbi:ribosome biogenesis factor YjgA [Methyloversatilis sp. MC4-4]|uniref:ribosome biogenesis factor YjgA n=1 Tax=Methyloversatilis sp. MC4-4 TaxID=3132824 RepID=UPI003CF84603